LWLAVLAAGLGPRLVRLVRDLPLAAAGPGERAGIESGDPALHGFLGRVKAAADAGASTDVLLVVADPANQHDFVRYRSAYKLYPLRAVYYVAARVPASPARFALPADGPVLVALKERRIGLAGVFLRDGKSEGFTCSVRVQGGRLVFTPLTTARAVPAEGGASRPWAWPVGAALVTLAGFVFSAGTGLLAAVGGGTATGLAVSFLAGAGLFAFIFLVASLAGLPIGWWAFVFPCAVAGLAVTAGRKWSCLRPRPATDEAPPPVDGLADRVGMALAVLGAVVVVLQSLVPLSAWANWDAWAVWGMRTKACFEARGVPWSFLEDGTWLFSHHDYPLGLPFLQGWLAAVCGGAEMRVMRWLFPLFHLALLPVMARLLLEFGLARGRWLVTGLFALVPTALEHASNGYAEPAVSAFMALGALLLVRTWKGSAPAWTVALACAFAAQVKDEGGVWTAGAAAVLAWWTVRGRIRSRALLAALAVAALLVLPWKLTARHLGLSPNDYRPEPSRLAANFAARAPLVAKALVVEALGPGADMATLSADGGGFGFVALARRQAAGWALLWWVVVAGAVIGSRRFIAPPGGGLAVMVAVQLCALAAVYLTTVLDPALLITWSMGRFLLQLAPLCLALALAAGLGAREGGSGREASR